jgi:hypothetical protein
MTCAENATMMMMMIAAQGALGTISGVQQNQNTRTLLHVTIHVALRLTVLIQCCCDRQMKRCMYRCMYAVDDDLQTQRA